MMRNVGTLLFTSEPAGADVMVDGRDYGPAPITVHLNAGRHHLSVSDGVRHHEETIQITTDGLYARSFHSVGSQLLLKPSQIAMRGQAR